MKKLFAILLGICLTTSVIAQPNDRLRNLILGNSPFYIQPLGYIQFGFSGMLQGDEMVTRHTSYFKNPQLGFSIVELGFNAGRYIQIATGADVSWTWYHVDRDYLWKPNEAGGTHLDLVTKESDGIRTVKQSIFTVPTFEFPLSFYFEGGRASLQLGASLELNVNGFTEFKGEDEKGQSINESRGGLRYTSHIKTRRLGYNAHAALLFHNVGLYAKFRPRPVVAEEYGPQFSTWTLGLMWRFPQ